jgi:hypothetical protein
MGLQTVRYIVPAVLVVVGFVILFTTDASLRWEGWAMCVGAGLAILLLNVLYRYGASGDKERDAEDEAREYFSRHGHWPDEEP